MKILVVFLVFLFFYSCKTFNSGDKQFPDDTNFPSDVSVIKDSSVQVIPEIETESLFGDLEPLRLENAFAFFLTDTSMDNQRLDIFYLIRSGEIEIDYRYKKVKITLFLPEKTWRHFVLAAELFLLRKKLEQPNDVQTMQIAAEIDGSTVFSTMAYTIVEKKDVKGKPCFALIFDSENTALSGIFPEAQLHFTPAQLAALLAKTDENLIQDKLDELDADIGAFDILTDF